MLKVFAGDVMAQPQSRTSPEDYLALERQAATKSEYLDGPEA